MADLQLSGQASSSELSGRRRQILRSLDIVADGGDESDEALAAALEAETRALENKMGIVTSLQQRTNEEEVVALMRQLAAFQAEDAAARFKFSASLSARVQAASASAATLAPHHLAHAQEHIRGGASHSRAADPGPGPDPTDPGADADADDAETSPSTALLRLLSSHEQELRHIAAARSRVHHAQNTAAIAALLAAKQRGELEVDSVLDYYYSELGKLCEGSRRTFAPLFAKAGHRLRALSQAQAEARAEARAGAGAGAGAGSWGEWADRDESPPPSPAQTKATASAEGANPPASPPASPAGTKASKGVNNNSITSSSIDSSSIDSSSGIIGSGGGGGGYASAYAALSSSVLERESGQLEALLARTRELGQGVVAARLAESVRALRDTYMPLPGPGPAPGYGPGPGPGPGPGLGPGPGPGLGPGPGPGLGPGARAGTGAGAGGGYASRFGPRPIAGPESRRGQGQSAAV